jgi:lactoylglutathione lyase
MTRIEHIAIWVDDLEKMKTFYQEYFGAQAGEKYVNPFKKYTSYFIRFENGARIELMNRPDIRSRDPGTQEQTGWAHIALSLGSRDKVVEMTEKMRKQGYRVAGEPRTTGDGYFESVILDPEGNRIELTI